MVTASLAYGASTSDAATRRVPSEYSTIQAAINASSPDDSVLVGPGLYQENLDTQGKRLTLVGEAGAAATVVDGNRRGSVVRLTGGGVVEGFTLRNGQAYEGGGVYVSDADGVVIRNNVIEQNLAGFQFDSGNGGGIAIRQVSEVLVERNTIRNNYAGAHSGGIDAGFDETDTVNIRKNEIRSNGCHVGGAGVSINQGSAGTFSENLVIDNVADSFDAGAEIYGGVVESNTIVGNYNRNTNPLAAGLWVANAIVTRNLVVHNHGLGGSGIGIQCGYSRLECNDSWGNDYADYDLFRTDTTGFRNVSLDPRFCDEAGGQFTLGTGSPCAPEGSQGCGLIGAHPVACTVVPTRRETWGSLKVRYR